MSEEEFDALIASLEAPLRVQRVPRKFVKRPDGSWHCIAKDTASLQFKNLEFGEWMHLITIPRGRIYRFRQDAYKSSVAKVPHRGLNSIADALIQKGFISPTEKINFVYHGI